MTFVNPLSDELVPFNVAHLLPGADIEAQADDVTLALTRLLDGDMSGNMENILRNLLMLLMETKFTLVESPDILRDENLLHVLVKQSSNPDVQDFFLPYLSRFAQGLKTSGGVQASILPAVQKP